MSSQCDDSPLLIDFQHCTEGSTNQSYLPHWPKQSLTLAIAAILTLIPHPQISHPFAEAQVLLRRSQAHVLAEAAFNGAEDEIDGSIKESSRTSGGIGESLEFNRQTRLYPILALSLLSVYEYCQRASISRMRSRANQAVTAAMDLSLDSLGHGSTEAERRTWWSAVSFGQNLCFFGIC